MSGNKFIAAVFCVAMAVGARANFQVLQKGTPSTILFVGNSYTHYPPVDDVVEAMLTERGYTVNATRITTGGHRLAWHYDDDGVADTIVEKEYDYVVLQDWSYTAMDSSAVTEFERVVPLFSDATTSYGGQVIMYMTWASKNEPTWWDPISELYGNMGVQIGGVTAPAGHAFKQVIKGDGKGWDYLLNLKDGKHPAKRGGYLIACVFYAVLTGESPVGIEHRTSNGASINDGTAAYLQRVAWDTYQAYIPPTQTDPAIVVSSTTLNISCSEGEDAAAATFDVWNGGADGTTLQYGIVENISEFDIATTNGVSTGKANKQTHTISFHTSTMEQGTYQRVFTVADNRSGSVNGPITVAVNITVMAPPPAVEIYNVDFNTVSGGPAGWNVFADTANATGILSDTDGDSRTGVTISGGGANFEDSSGANMYNSGTAPAWVPSAAGDDFFWTGSDVDDELSFTVTFGGLIAGEGVSLDVFASRSSTSEILGYYEYSLDGGSSWSGFAVLENDGSAATTDGWDGSDTQSQMFNLDETGGYALGRYMSISNVVLTGTNLAIRVTSPSAVSSYAGINAMHLTLTHATPVDYKETYYVDPALGDDANDGMSASAAFKTIEQARQMVDAVNDGMTADIDVCLRGGIYELASTLAFTSGDSGSNGHTVSYKAYGNEIPIISGGKKITGWTPVGGTSYWSASVAATNGFASYFRQIFVNGVRAERAHSQWCVPNNFVNDAGTPEASDGFSFDSSEMPNYMANPADLTLFHVAEFKAEEFRIVEVRPNGAETELLLGQPHFQVRVDRGSRYLDDDQDYMVIGALEDLDSPGEWCLDSANETVYYYPYSFEDMATAEIYAPVIETIVSLEGSSTNAQVENLIFEGLTFEHGNWLFPGSYLFGGTQAQSLYAPDVSSSFTYAYEMPGQIVLNHTSNIQFSGNTFRRMGSCGIQLYNDSQDTLVEGNTFYDLTGAAVTAGRLEDWRIFVPGQATCRNLVVQNNVIRNIGPDFFQATGLDLKNLYGSRVMHNDISDTAYAGIHQRFGTNHQIDRSIGDSRFANNLVSRATEGRRWGVQDAGHIYTHGIAPGTVIESNLVEHCSNHSTPASRTLAGFYMDNDTFETTVRYNIAKDIPPEGEHSGFYFPDRGNDAATVSNSANYTDSQVNELVDTVTTGFRKVLDGAWPARAQAIMAGAGLEPEYQHLARRWYSGVNLARGKEAWASSVYVGSTTRVAGNATDGDLSTSWITQSGGESTLAWIAVDLGKPYVIQKFYYAPRTGLDHPNTRKDFEIQVSNDRDFSDWVVIAEQNGISIPRQSIAFEDSKSSCVFLRYIDRPEGYRYLRIMKTVLLSTTSVMDVAEIGVFGYDPAVIHNSHATNVTHNSADLVGTLAATQTPYHAYCYWGSVDGANNATGLWENTDSLGWHTNVNISLTNAIDSLSPDTQYYFRYYVANAQSAEWATPTMSFSTSAGVPPSSVVYQDNFDNDGVGSNTGIGGGAFVVTGGGDTSTWTDNGNAVHSANDADRSRMTSSNSFQSDLGLILTVEYSISDVSSVGRNQFAFGLHDLATNPSGTYNPFGDPGYYSLGLNLTPDDGRATGLIFQNGSSISALDATTFTTGTHTAVVTIATGGDWSWTLDAIDQESGTIAGGFDFTKSYAFSAYGRDNESTKLIISATMQIWSYDLDADGMPDAWEVAHGLNPATNDASADSDGDGADNYAEYLADTNPTNKLSVFSVSILPATDMIVSWDSSANRQYSLWYSTNLLETASWTRVGQVTDRPGTGGTIVVTNPVAGSQGYFKATSSVKE
jgi:hypothetical protein